jgi:hypothetical protein
VTSTTSPRATSRRYALNRFFSSRTATAFMAVNVASRGYMGQADATTRAGEQRPPSGRPQNGVCAQEDQETRPSALSPDNADLPRRTREGVRVAGRAGSYRHDGGPWCPTSASCAGVRSGRARARMIRAVIKRHIQITTPTTSAQLIRHRTAFHTAFSVSRQCPPARPCRSPRGPATPCRARPGRTRRGSSWGAGPSP